MVQWWVGEASERLPLAGVGKNLRQNGVEVNTSLLGRLYGPTRLVKLVVVLRIVHFVSGGMELLHNGVIRPRPLTNILLDALPVHLLVHVAVGPLRGDGQLENGEGVIMERITGSNRRGLHLALALPLRLFVCSYCISELIFLVVLG